MRKRWAGARDSAAAPVRTIGIHPTRSHVKGRRVRRDALAWFVKVGTYSIVYLAAGETGGQRAAKSGSGRVGERKTIQRRVCKRKTNRPKGDGGTLRRGGTKSDEGGCGRQVRTP